MFRMFGAFLLTLLLAALLAAAPARAQVGQDYPERSGPPPMAQPNGPQSSGYLFGSPLLPGGELRARFAEETVALTHRPARGVD